MSISALRKASPIAAASVEQRATIEIIGISKNYGALEVLNDCSMSIRKGEAIVVCGPSGSGKSTLLKCVNGLETFQSGTIVVDGVSVGWAVWFWAS